jgi:sulfhydrogenase subunit beta (sulfur reductase)
MRLRNYGVGIPKPGPQRVSAIQPGASPFHWLGRSSVTGKVLGTEAFDTLIPLLSNLGYIVVGPTLANGTISYSEIDVTEDLPIGWTDRQEAGTYGVERRNDDAYFGYRVGPQTLRRFLSPPHETLLTIEHHETGLRFHPEPPPEQKYAFLGVRACDLAAVEIQDKVFAGTSFSDPRYVAARARSLTVGVNCSEAGATCFCASMGSGPRCTVGFDLVVTEVMGQGRHDFVVVAGTERGQELLDRLDGRPMTTSDSSDVDRIIEDTTRHMGRSIPAEETHELLTRNLEHPMWESIGERCLSCASCTLVCPTCFCSTTGDTTDLTGTAVRQRRWDSCFNLDFTNLHGHPVRSSPAARYRQWMTHKLAYWYDQFGTSGCVGCGRCITWCPVGIDITHEIAELRKDAEVMA